MTGTDQLSFESQLVSFRERLQTVKASLDDLTAAVRQNLDAQTKRAVEDARNQTQTDLHIQDNQRSISAVQQQIKDILSQLPHFVTQAQHIELVQMIRDQATIFEGKILDQSRANASAITELSKKIDSQTADLPTIRRVLVWLAGVLTIVVAGVIVAFATGHLAIVVH